MKFEFDVKVDVHVHLLPADLQAAIRLIPGMKEVLTDINSRSIHMAGELDTLTTDVAATRTLEASAITLLQGLKAKLDAAGTDPVKLKALSDSLESGQQALADAITANTPADDSGTGTGDGSGTTTG